MAGDNGSRNLYKARPRSEFDDMTFAAATADPEQRVLLTPTQRDLYLHEVANPCSALFNTAISVDLGPELDPAIWQAAVVRAVREDPVGGCRFVARNAEICQQFTSDYAVDYRFVDLSAPDSCHRSSEQYLTAESERPFDLERPPLLRNYLLREADGGFTAAALFAHIALDGMAMKALLERIAQIYEALRNDEEPRLLKRPCFADYVAKELPEFDAVETLAHWRNELRDAELPDFVGERTEESALHWSRLQLDQQTTAAARDYCRRHGLNLAAFFMALYAFLLRRYADADGDSVILSILSGRSRRHLRTLGCFYQVLPYLFPQDRFDDAQVLNAPMELAANYRRDLGECENLSLSALNRILPPGGLRCYFNFQSFARLRMFGERRYIRVFVRHPDDELQLLVTDADETIRLELGYHQQRFPDLNFLERLAGLARQICDGRVRFADLDILLPAEHEALHGTAPPAPVEAEDVLHRFERRVADNPGAIAVSYVPGPEPDLAERVELDYAELNARANRLAHYLQRRGVGPEMPVAILLERSPDLAVALLAVVKSGGAYLPIDPEAPAERVEFMLRDANPVLLITCRELLRGIGPGRRDVLCLDRDAEVVEREPTHDPVALAEPDNLAYIIYTSGSSGRPKGVLVTRRNLARLFTQTESWFEFTAADVWTLFHSCAFDFSVWEFWGALVYGGRLVIVPSARVRSASEFYRLLHDEKVTVLNQTPSAFQVLVQVDARTESRLPLALRYVIFGGEALKPETLAGWIDRHGDDTPQLFNLYGITETTVHVSGQRLRREDIVGASVSPIGTPISDLRVYLLDRGRRPVPPGLPGEIYVAGAGVARGYLNRPQLTVARFLPDPLFPQTSDMVYRSGDLGRLDGSGKLEYLGRADEQIKIDGYRIEPGEIEIALLEHPAVTAAVVGARDEVGASAETQEDAAANRRRLVAWLVPAGGATLPAIDEWRELFASRLPAYMIPAAFVELDALPLTRNGKIDRAQLPAPGDSRPALRQKYAAPESATEIALAKIAAGVLRIAEVGRDDNFFDLGGNSLAAMQFAAQAWERLQIELPLRRFFEQPTVAQLAASLDAPSPNVAPAGMLELRPVPRDELLPLSVSQERVWFLQQLDPDIRAYEFLATIRFSGKLDVDALRRSLDEIVRRHEIYRSTFGSSDGRPCQRVEPPWPVTLPVVDLAGTPPDERQQRLEREIAKVTREGFSLDRLPLARWSLLRLAHDSHLLVHFEHHLLHDGWSFTVFLRELIDLYRAFTAGEQSPLAEPALQFADFARCQREWLDSGVAEQQLDYWRDRLSGSPPLLELPTDRPRPPRPSYRGDQVRLDCESELTGRLETFARTHGVTVHMVLLAAFAVLLARYSGQRDLVIGAGVANRRWPGSENLLGMMLNNLALRFDLADNPGASRFLHRVRELTLEAYDYQDVPFDRVVEAVNPPRSPVYPPLFQALFTSYDGEIPKLDLPGLTLEMEEGLPLGTAKYDLNVVVIVRDKPLPVGKGVAPTICLIWEYSSDLFERETVTRMLRHYRALIDSMLADPERPVFELDLLDEAERRQMLVDWNDTRSDYPREATIASLFEAVATKTPGNVALEAGGSRLTYADLNARANRLAWRLIHSGLELEAPVAVCLPRGVELVVALLAIVKAGGAYLPLDPDYPVRRLNYMLADSDARRLLTESGLRARFAEFDGSIIEVDDDLTAGQPDTNPRPPLTADNLAYAMYTSGSTGEPKGVCVEHRAVVRLVRDTDYVELGPDEVLLQLAPAGFDASTFEIWGALLNGSKLVLYPPADPTPEALGRFLIEREITTLWLTASLFHLMVEQQGRCLGNLRQLLAGGEALSPGRVDRARFLVAPGGRVINGYGPTEGTTFSCCYPVPRQEELTHTVPIGRPIANTRVYVLDEVRQPVPIGVAGELYIGGDGLARGYLHQPQLTASRFLPSPLAEEPGRLYRSGDRVRYRADGTIEFLGRLDQQVKLHGYRIEPAEIERLLDRHPAVRDAKVLLHEEESGDKRLLAYLIPGGGDIPPPAELRRYLAETLPRFMLPADFLTVETWPLTPNGKLDLAALPTGSATASAAREPRNDTERAIADIWCDILRVDAVGVDDDFFVLGGHSLIAGQVLNRVRDEFGLEIPLRRLFDDPTVAGLSRHVDAARAGTRRLQTSAAEIRERGEI